MSMDPIDLQATDIRNKLRMHLPSKFHKIISHLFSVYDKTEYPDHSALIINQILLHVVSTLGLRLSVAGEVSLVTVQH